MAGMSPSDRLLTWYRQYIGDPVSETDVYLGFALFIGGTVLGLFGLLVFLTTQLLDPSNALFWQFREIAVVFAGIGFPFLLLGVSTLLPVVHRARYAALVGFGVCVLAAAFFTTVYPHQWNVPRGPDYSPHGITVYAIGLAVLVATTGASLITYHLERVRPSVQESTETEPDDEASVTDEQVERDIQEALSQTDLSWGGVEKRETQRLQINVDDSDIDRSGFDSVAPTTTRSTDVDDAVSGLNKLRGGASEQATGETVDDQAAALQQLRDQQETDTANEQPSGLLTRLKALLVRLRISLRKP